MLPVIFTSFWMLMQLEAVGLNAMLPAGMVPVEVEVVYFDRKPIIAATLNGKTAYFLLDTGASVSILNGRDRKAYDFRTSQAFQRENLYGFGGGSASVQHAYQIRLSIGEALLQHQWAAKDLEDLFRRMQRHTQVKVNGIIGADLMQAYGFVIDFAQQEVWMTSPVGQQLTQRP